MEKKITKELVYDYFRLLYKYPVYIEMFKQNNSWSNLSSHITENSANTNRKDLSTEEIYDFLYTNYMVYVSAEEEIGQLESEQKYDYPTFGFDFEKNKKYTEDKYLDITEKIIYYTYLLKEYPQHITNRMRILSEKLNDIILKGDYVEKFIYLMNGINSEISGMDILFPVPPLRYEELISNELKYLNVQLSMDMLESSHDQSKQSNHKLKEEIKKLKETIDNSKKEAALLTIKETLDYLKISRTTLHRLIKNQILHYIIIGKKKYIDKAEIDNRLEIIDGKRKM